MPQLAGVATTTELDSFGCDGVAAVMWLCCCWLFSGNLLVLGLGGLGPCYWAIGDLILFYYIDWLLLASCLHFYFSL